jgi:hypothetical protein
MLHSLILKEFRPAANESIRAAALTFFRSASCATQIFFSMQTICESS